MPTITVKLSYKSFFFYFVDTFFLQLLKKCLKKFRSFTCVATFTLDVQYPFHPSFFFCILEESVKNIKQMNKQHFLSVFVTFMS